MNKIEVNGIVKRFGNVTAVDGISFNVREEEVLGLLGPSGCGKTTILRCIAGLEEIDEGEILIDGIQMTSKKGRRFIPAEKRGLGLVFQNYALWPHMTVRQNVAYGLQGRGLRTEAMQRRVESSLDLLGLYGLGERYPSQLSGGQQQRVAVARSLSYEPKVLLLDEPLSNLDLKERERVRGDLRLLLKRIGITTVFVTHDQEEAFVISDRVTLLNHGKIVQEGLPVELYAKPANSFVAGFIGRANILKVEIGEVICSEHTVKVLIPEMGAELMCEYEEEFPRDASLVVVRFNEIGLSGDPKAFKDNVVEGKVISREYRGAMTDYKIRVRNCQIVVSTHKFSSLGGVPGKDTVYIHIPRQAIRIVPN